MLLIVNIFHTFVLLFLLLTLSRLNTHFFYKQIHTFFISSALIFSSPSVLHNFLINWASIIIPRHFLYMVVTMFRRRPIFVLSRDLLFIFINIFTFLQTYFFFLLVFDNMYYYLWMKTWMTNVNSFQIAKVQPQGVA